MREGDRVKQGIPPDPSRFKRYGTVVESWTEDGDWYYAVTWDDGDTSDEYSEDIEEVEQ